MKLFELLKGVKCRIFGSSLIEVDGLFHFDKDIKGKGLFFCLNGTNTQGEEYVLSAINRGAVAIVSEKEIKGLHKITQILVKNVRKAMSLIAINYYNNPAKDLKLIGITGTNGKTSTTYILMNMLNYLGYPTAIIGTNGVIYNNKKIETEMTTPDPIELQRILYKLKNDNIKFVCMEVSAHSVYYYKTEGLKFEIMIFSNLTEDHLDFFKTMDEYYKAKKRIFSPKYTKCALINIDDYYGKNLFDSINMPKKTYAIKNKADYSAVNLGIKDFNQEILIQDNIIKTKLLGEFNIYNLISSIACLKILNIGITNLQNLILSISEIPGRFNCRVVNNKLFVIDYAHTPDGLENVLKLCKSIVDKEKKLICVFGCGGNRETQKRSKMGEISSNFADFTIITSDNPRYEDELMIAKDIESGFKNNRFKIILDRKDAIKCADKISDVGDIILIAGKGSEGYIDKMGVKRKYSDYEEVEKLRK